jgi:hypothetical protein
VFCVHFRAWWTRYLDSVSAARLAQIPLSLLLLELIGYYLNTIQLHVNAADVLVRRGIDRDGSSAASGYVCPVDDAAESFVVGVVITPDDVPADHAGLLLVTGVVGAVEREVPQRRELRLYSV